MAKILKIVLSIAALVTLQTMAYYSLGREILAPGYPTTTGRIVHSQVWISMGGKSGRTPIEHADVRYEYQVKAAKYLGDTVHTEGLLSSVDARNVVRRYPTSAAVKVYYDPAQPDWARLEPGLIGSDFCWIFLLIYFNAAILASLANLNTPPSGEGRRSIFEYGLVSPWAMACVRVGVLSIASFALMLFVTPAFPSQSLQLGYALLFLQAAVGLGTLVRRR